MKTKFAVSAVILVALVIFTFCPTWADKLPVELRDPDYERVVNKAPEAIVKEQISIRLDENMSGLGDVIYLEAPVLLKCRIVKPKDFNAEKTYPLVVGLHGYSSNPERFMYLWDALDQPPIIYAVPQGPYALPEGPILGYSWSVWDVEDQNMLPKSSELTQKYILRLVEGLKQAYKIDKTYLLGFSQGSAFGFITAINNPDRFDGVVSLGGWLPREQFTDEQLQRANKLRVFFGHGKRDEAINLGLAKHSSSVLASFKYQTVFREYDCAHEIPAAMLQNVVDWILK